MKGLVSTIAIRPQTMLMGDMGIGGKGEVRVGLSSTSESATLPMRDTGISRTIGTNVGSNVKWTKGGTS